MTLTGSGPANDLAVTALLDCGQLQVLLEVRPETATLADDLPEVHPEPATHR